jgi:hypothetical protein
MMKRWLLLCFLILLSQPMRAQDRAEAHFLTNLGAPLVGEPIELTLTATIPAGAIMISWPEFPADWWPLEVQNVGELSIGATEYHQNLTVILWIPGDYQTPETTITYQLAENAETQTLVVEPAFFSIPSVLDGQDMALRPFKAQISLPYVSPLVIAAGAAGLGALSFVAIRRLRSVRAIVLKRTVDEDGLGPAARAALAELRRIALLGLPPDQLYAATANCLRTYIHDQMNIPALDLTTAELMGSLRLPDALQRELQRILEQADLVKFARYQPSGETAQKYLDVAGKWVRAADQKETA